MALKRHVGIEAFGRGYTPLESPPASGLTKAAGVVSHLGAYRKRAGRHVLGTALSEKPLDLFSARFNQIPVTFAGTSTSLYMWDDNNSNWVNVSPTGGYVINTSVYGHAQYGGKLYVCQRAPTDYQTSKSGIVSKTTEGSNESFTPEVNTPGGNWLSAYAARLFILAPMDPDGSSYPNMVRFSGAFLPTTFYDTQQGSGYVLLDEDNYPCEAAFVYGGRLYVFKGGMSGGSTYVITATTDTTFPIIYEKLFSIGIRGRRSLVQVSDAQYYFLGTDNVYEFNSGRLVPIGTPIAQEILDNLDNQALNDVFSVYDSDKQLVTFVIPTTGGQNLAYTYDAIAKTWTGPDDWTGITCGCRSAHASYITWADLTTRGWTWKYLGDNGIRWSDMFEITGAPFTALGKDDGNIYETSYSFADDAGGNVNVEIITGAYTFTGTEFRRLGKRFAEQAMDGDLIGVDGIMLRYKGSPTLTISISTDVGETWTQVWTGTLPNNTDYDHAIINFPMVVGPSFMFKFVNQSSTETWSINKNLTVRAMFISGHNIRSVV